VGRRSVQCLRALVALVATAILALLAATPALAASAGSIDTTFGTGGFSTVSIGSIAGAAAVVVQPDGRIVTAGAATISGQSVIVSTRMNASGTLDPSYGVGGIVTVSIYNGGGVVDSGAALALQSDGKIVMVGGGRNGNFGQMSFAAVRLLPNGSFDSSFGTGGIATVPIGTSAIATAVVIQPDGKIALAGTAVVSHNEFAAARLNPNGTLDTSFGTGGTTTFSPTGGAWGMALQSDGKLVLAGQANYNNPSVSGAQQFMAVRLLPNGAPDAGFGQAGIVTVPVGGTALGFGVAAQNDGKLVLVGPAWTTTCVNAVVRLRADGSLDSTYGSGGIGMVKDCYGANGIILDSSGRAVIPAVGASAVRFNTDGTPDGGFGTGGMALAKIGSTGGANGAAIQPSNGKIVLAGAANISGQVVLTVIRLNDHSSTPPAHTAGGPTGSPPRLCAARRHGPAARTHHAAGRRHKRHARSRRHKRHARRAHFAVCAR
jgi:uncharacterized delta-60 repeat protein